MVGPRIQTGGLDVDTDPRRGAERCEFSLEILGGGDQPHIGGQLRTQGDSGRSGGCASPEGGELLAMEGGVADGHDGSDGSEVCLFLSYNASGRPSVCAPSREGL